ncbi:MAG: hypothetical protein M3Z33_13325 [Actinomycetota bacterium]|nr:hypothetical protein [Actinomycetota bacterium]
MRTPAAQPVWGTRSVVAGCIVLAAFSLLLPSTLAYDPWWWVIWGRETAHLALQTSGGPSWKPLPVAFTTVYSVFGDASPALWLVTARTGYLLATAMAFRLARRAAGRFAGVAAVVGVAAVMPWEGGFLLGRSEGIAVACMLWALERYLDGARRHALLLGFAAALVRPEVWPVLGAYAACVWVREPQSRRLVAATVALVPALWFLPELLSSGEPFRASSRARMDLSPAGSRGFQPALDVARALRIMLLVPVKVGAVLGLGLALYRRDRTVLGVAALGGSLLAIEVGMALAGYPVESRFVMLIGVPGCVVAGAGMGWVVGLAPARLLRIAAGVVVIASAAPFVLHRADVLRRYHGRLDHNARVDGDLGAAVKRAGGHAAIRRCGRPSTDDSKLPILTWYLGGPRDVALRRPPPTVIFRARPTLHPHRVPPRPHTHARFPVVVRVGEWQVLARCRASIMLRPRA